MTVILQSVKVMKLSFEPISLALGHGYIAAGGHNGELALQDLSDSRFVDHFDFDFSFSDLFFFVSASILIYEVARRSIIPFPFQNPSLLSIFPPKPLKKVEIWNWFRATTIKPLESFRWSRAVANGNPPSRFSFPWR